MAMAEKSQNGEGDGAEALSALELTKSARKTIEDLTGFTPESVSGMQWDGENWLVTVEVCELERIPNTTDVLASYIVQLDDRGGLLGYKRDRRYPRGQAEAR
jgi:hypothetical protein